ncbi:MAG TPA: glycerophosphoryl diester phosphodiesterase membrane domain-containing protein [bacterium]
MGIAYDEDGKPASLIDLRPMDLADILDATIRVYRSNPWVFISILVSIIGIPVYISSFIEKGYIRPAIELALKEIANVSASTQTMEILNVFKTNEFLIAAGVLGVVMLFNVFLMPIAQAAVVSAVSESILGRETSFQESLDSIREKLASLIAAYFLVILIYVLLFSPFAIFLLVADTIYSNPGAILGFLGIFNLSFILFIFLFFKLLFIPHSIVLDHVNAANAFRRSFSLTSGYWWRILGIYLVVNIIVGMIVGLFSGIVYFVDLGLAGVSSSEVVVLGVGALFNSIISLMLQPVTLIAMTLIYYDLRIRKEGFDMVILAQAMSEETETQESTNSENL